MAGPLKSQLSETDLPMAVSSKASATAIFDLKSAALTVLALVLKTPDLDPLATALGERFGATPGLFEHEPLCIDVSALRDAPAALDFPALIDLLRSYGFNPMSARGGTAAQMAAALAAGLAEAPDTAPPRNPATPAVTAAAPAPADAAGAEELVADAAAADANAGPAWSDTVPPDLFAEADRRDAETSAHDEAAVALAPAAEAPPVPVAGVPALVIDKPLRSGQQVYARGSDLIVLAVVSFGAEVIADGNIHIYAPLRGRALAGARGDTSARIFTTSMEAQLVSIAGTWRTTESGVPEGVTGRPAQVRLDGDKLIFEPLKF